MEHLLVKAATTAATDEGTFTAVISSIAVDRDGDIVEPTAIVAALAKWADLGKLVPLAWDHTKHVVGHIDPGTARVKGGEVVADGYIDQAATGENNEPLGERAWRLVKSGTLSFSYGMLIPETGATKRANGGLHITELDLYEVSVIPIAPANNDTRVLAWKSAEKLREAAEKTAREVEQAAIPDDVPPAPAEPEAKAADPDVTQELQEVKDRLHTLEKALEDLKTKADETAKEQKAARAVDPLRKQADTVALEVAAGGQPPNHTPVPEPAKPEPELTLKALRQRSRDEMLSVLSGGTTP